MSGLSNAANPSKPDMLTPQHSLAQFGVIIDSLPNTLWFTGCDGLSAEYTIEEIQEGGNNEYSHKLPGRVKYSNVKLTRLLNADSNAIASWVSNFQRRSVDRYSAVIHLYGVDLKPVCTWTLQHIHPVKWTGPTFAADGSGIAKETLEIAHHGFLWTPKVGAPPNRPTPQDLAEFE